MRLLAISDLHVGYPVNRDAVDAMEGHPEDWLIIAGDVGETLEQLAWTLDTLGPRFAQLLWVPGNHELWSHPSDRSSSLRGQARYHALVGLCRERGVLTPEDAWPLWPGGGPPTVIVPMFLGFDYSFGPEGFSPDQVRAWSREDGIVSADERFLHPDPFRTREDWCRDRVERTRTRLESVDLTHQTVLINHWPLRIEHVRLRRIPRFVPWCGTRSTHEWHRRFRARACVYGHLHMRATDWVDGVRFEEVAVGYPRHWVTERGLDAYLRVVLPRDGEAPPNPTPESGFGGPIWHR